MMATVAEPEPVWDEYEAFKASLRKLLLRPDEYEAMVRQWCDEHGY